MGCLADWTREGSVRRDGWMDQAGTSLVCVREGLDSWSSQARLVQPWSVNRVVMCAKEPDIWWRKWWLIFFLSRGVVQTIWDWGELENAKHVWTRVRGRLDNEWYFFKTRRKNWNMQLWRYYLRKKILKRKWTIKKLYHNHFLAVKHFKRIFSLKSQRKRCSKSWKLRK